MVSQDKKEFVINSHLSLKLEEGKTKIFVDGEEFLICKAVILNIPKDKISEVRSMDDILEVSEIIEDEEEFTKYSITPLTEFWVHCSNLQVWAENNYNADLLQTNLAFPLLKRLVDLGDIKAKRIFKEEIARRYAHGTYDTQNFLEFEEFLDYLTREELLVGGLSFEESSLLLDIIDFMKRIEITYEIVKSFDEDKVRHRMSSLERYLTLKNGHVYVFEFDLFHKTAHLFNRFSVFKGMRYLKLNLGDLMDNVPDLSRINCDSIVALDILHYSLSEIHSKLFDCFPNVEYLTIKSPFKHSLTNVDPISSLKKLKTLEFNDCISEKHLKKLNTIKNKNLKITNIKN